MPRKSNGFGAFGFNQFGSFNNIEPSPAAGIYPSDRRFGTTVVRSAIEKWNIDSNWAKWRRGNVLYNNAYYANLTTKNLSYDPGSPKGGSNIPYVPASIASTLYPGQTYSINMLFGGYEFPTANADGNTYYAVRRTPQSVSLGTPLSVLSQIYNVDGSFTNNYLNKEIIVTVNPNQTYSRLLLSMIGDRLIDGDTNNDYRTEATLKRVLTADNKPSIYIGKTLPKQIESTSSVFKSNPTNVTITIPVSSVNVTTNTGTFLPNQGIESPPENVPNESLDILNKPSLLIGNIIYIQDFFIDKPISSLNTVVWNNPATEDDKVFVELKISESETSQSITGLNAGVNNLPPSMLDLASLPTIFTTTNGSYTIEGSYVFRKSDYQPFFEKYFTSETISQQVIDISYSVLPFTVQKAEIINNELLIKAVPFLNEIRLYPTLTSGTQLIFSDNSFSSYAPLASGKTQVDIDVNPWVDQVFTNTSIRPAVVYSCSCPSYTRGMLAMPQSTQNNNERKTNRQKRYPLPTSQSPNSFDSVGTNTVAGKVSSWANPSYAYEHKICKHTIAAMNIDNFSIKEPNDYPSVETRVRFSEKINKDMEELAEAYNTSYRRSGISVSEIVFALSQGLNLDPIETAYVVLNSTQRYHV